MSFNSVGFLIFLPVTVLVNYILPKKIRWVWLLAASYFFYMSWRPEMALLILSVTLVAYFAGLAAGHFNEKGNKTGAHLAVAAACVLCIGALMFFKYFAFIMENVDRIVSGGGTLNIPDIILPVGISFYTFQAMGYVIDVARGRLAAEKHVGYFALFVSFFPQLVAGPIEKAEVLLPQLRSPEKPSLDNVYSGLGRILIGFFKKIAVADMLAGPVNAIFADPSAAGSALTALGAVLFAVQIFCDFSGYTDIATGAAALLGVRLSKNFDRPYASLTLGDFWRRWHISLSGWFRDYVYIPLGGSKKGSVRTAVNLLIIFLLSGLWHGAAWHFVVWGLLHGLLVVIGRFTLEPRNRFWKKVNVDPESTLIKAIRRVVTFATVCFLWIFFRAGSMSDAVNVISTIFSFKGGSAAGIFTDAAGVFIAAAGIAVLWLIDSGRAGLSIPMGENALQKKNDRTRFVAPAAVIVMIWAVVWAWLLLSSTSAASAFIYFQF